MERLTKYITPVGKVMTNLNSMKHYMPCAPCREKAEIKYKNGKGYTEKFSFCDTCEVKMLFNKLKEYEDLEEQGLLLRLPCKVGDVLYQPTRDFVSEFEIKFIEVSVCNNLFFHTKLTKGINMTGEIFSEDKIDKTVFLTKEQAEAKMKEIEGSEGE